MRAGSAGSRWSAARRAGGYAAALAMSLYLVVKVVAVGLALARPWGRRLPARP
ncbi:hypothetical protein [Actinomadura rugatobispora]|uniref:Uncharacterized protein n=1 Tax=Actinomadura rugatobispora TaxID=1994 RepID=A0ABW1A0E8_9ACTN|nr:hypothetical protein GCM10010200_013940 [Actinomadura rugatobispora]